MVKALKLEQVVKAVNGTLLNTKNSNDIVIDNVTTDTRKIQKGDLFIPIKGEKYDGHNFIEQAFEKGAICCFSENIIDNGKIVIKVENTRKALRDLAEYYKSLFQVIVVGVTGSVGKTTTKDMIACVLAQKYNILKTEGNYNNEIGLPATVFQLNENHKVVILEMGMNSFGEIHNLSKIARPDIGVITNIGVSHIENLGSREGILKAKSEIFDYMSKSSSAILNGDDDMLTRLHANMKMETIWFGIRNKEGIYANQIEAKGLEGISCHISTDEGNFYVDIPVPGEHMVLNALSATAVGLQLGLTVEEIKKGIEEFVPTKMRMSVIKNQNGLTIINDAYNANPVSMKAAIDVLAGIKGKKTAIMGDMFELGEYSRDMHYDVGKYAAENKIDMIICIGEASQAMCQGALDCGHRNVFYYPKQEQFWEEGIDNITNDNTVLVKASRGMYFEKTIEKIKEVR